jgi:protein-L-isoaspartate(D-aspartate) O-methyltransferase
VSLAYADRALAIGNGQTISQPYMVAVMTQALALLGGERVLEIGTGSGYQAAILGELAREVVTIERHADLAEAARVCLESLGFKNISVVVGDGTANAAVVPYDAILVTAGAPRVPESLKAQLADGGRLVIPIGSHAHQELTVIVRRRDALVESLHEGCVFVPLVGLQAWPEG